VVVTKCFAAASVMGAGDVAELEHVSAGVLMGFNDSQRLPGRHGCAVGALGA